MKPSSFENAIRLQFDCLARKVIGRTVKNYDEHGNMYIVVDMELKGRIRAALIKAILGFEVRVK